MHEGGHWTCFPLTRRAEDDQIFGLAQSEVAERHRVDGVGITEPRGERGRELRIDPEYRGRAHQMGGLRGEDGMIKAATREPKARGDVVQFEIRQLVDDLRRRKTSSKQVEHIDHPDAHAADARPAAAFARFHGDPFQ